MPKATGAGLMQNAVDSQVSSFFLGILFVWLVGFLLFYFSLCVYMYLCVEMYTEAQSLWRQKRALKPSEFELQAFESCLDRVLGSEPWYS